ncbi:uncharacterized protein ColSpa_08137 [Colletotrichum spaethianum]|uniref:Uncharacterized protein n=1 Tax=Colletotrichum spaethianum TaxID=700344 RepID=A0AA37UJG3_9PEZI|nr:uncharacterized protein ColSpa_08137 [Colletotrichum spaethianum]GKT47956.1 hypothetical protein ColSpa_08137 [Colletotrichum spaethianum]
MPWLSSGTDFDNVSARMASAASSGPSWVYPTVLQVAASEGETTRRLTASYNPRRAAPTSLDDGCTTDTGMDTY